MTTTRTEGHGGDAALHPSTPSGDGPQTNGGAAGALIEEAGALRDALRDADGWAARLVAALKRQQKQSRLMASALAGLKQLQQFAP